MRRRRRTIGLTVVSLFIVVYWCAIWAGARAGAAAAPQSSEGEARGRRIYFAGEDGTAEEIGVLLGGEELEAPATAFACASCHGDDGAGTREGGVQPPPITWESLTAPRFSSLANRKRAPYDAASLARAVVRGVDAEGFPLHASMPRYRMTERQAADLISFLKILGTDGDADPGINAHSIRVGAALPLSGTLAPVGEAVRSTLTAYFETVNARGGVYGRRVELVFEDSKGNPPGTLDATRKLIEERRAFALVAGFEPAGDAATADYLKRQSVPLVGPLTLSPRPSVPPNPSIFYLLPTARDQARALVEFVHAESERTGEARAAGVGARLAVVSSEAEFDRDAAEGASLQAHTRHLKIASTRTYRDADFAPAELAAELARAKATHVLFFGGPREFDRLARALEATKHEARFFGLALTLGRAALGLPPSLAARTYLAHPTPLPDRDAFAEFLALTRRAGAGAQSPTAFQAVAYGAARIFTEAVKLSGRRLSRATLVNSLEQLRDFDTGVLPPVAFDANRRVGASGAYIVRADPDGKRFVPLTGWLALGAERGQ